MGHGNTEKRAGQHVMQQSNANTAIFAVSVKLFRNEKYSGME
mgnify:CR=1 FL=1